MRVAGGPAGRKVGMQVSGRMAEMAKRDKWTGLDRSDTERRGMHADAKRHEI
jgi:hypothetical protein